MVSNDTVLARLGASEPVADLVERKLYLKAKWVGKFPEIEKLLERSKLENMVVSRDGCTVDHPNDECPLDRGAAAEVAVRVAVLLGEGVAVGVPVRVAVGDAVAVGVGDSVGDGVTVGIRVSVAVAVSVGVAVPVGVRTGLGVPVAVGEGVSVGVAAPVPFQPMSSSRGRARPTSCFAPT